MCGALHEHVDCLTWIAWDCPEGSFRCAVADHRRSPSLVKPGKDNRTLGNIFKCLRMNMLFVDEFSTRMGPKGAPKR